MSDTVGTPHVTLRAIDNDNFHPVINLEVREEQGDFVAPNIYSIAETHVEPSFVPLAVYAGETLVGFTMYGFRDDVGGWWIFRLMIDRRYQGNGYGEAATLALIDLMTERESMERITLSYEPHNNVAAALYRSLGFQETGEVEDGEVVAVLHLER